MSDLIRELSAEVVKKIAAGEVIDRPDAVVKELIENSLDAGASKIEIHLEKGGLKKIEVRDDGRGMSSNDLRKCFLPHTTSKISTLADLEILGSYGFRGEALASMVEVAKVSLESRLKTQPTGHRLVVKDGKIIEDKNFGMPVGTRILVEALFSGIPARKKYINNIQRELTYILKRVTSFALVNYQLQLSLFHEGKKLFEVFCQPKIEARVKEIFGNDFVEQSLSYSFEIEHIKLSGFIGKPQLSLRSPGRQYLFVNGRAVRNHRLAKAIRDAYGSLLEPKAYPAFILFLNLPSQIFDINIHPRKEEVLIFKEELLVSELFTNLQSFFQTKDLTYVLKSKPNSINYLLRDRATDVSFKENFEVGWQLEDKVNQVGDIFQFQNTYLFFELNGELMVVDQHAAHEMILYKDFKNQFEKNLLANKKKFLINQKINLSKEDYFIFKQNQNIFSKIGFIFFLTKKDELIIEQSPAVFSKLDLERVILDLLADISNYGKVVEPDLLTNRALSFLACRSAIKAGDYLTSEQKQNIVQKIIQENTLYTCPHGRPLKIKISKQELEKMFFRKK